MRSVDPVIQAGPRRVSAVMSIMARLRSETPPAGIHSRRTRRTGSSPHLPARTHPKSVEEMPDHDQLATWMLAVAKQGDREAFAALFDHLAPRIKGFLIRSGTEPLLAEELAQETMVALWRKSRLFDPQKAGVTTWVYRIARNLRIDQHRRSKGATQELLDDHEQWLRTSALYDIDAVEPEQMLLAAQREQAVRLALSELSTHQQLLLRLSFFEEHAHGRISEELGIPLGTVKSRIRLALVELRRKLQTKLT